MKNQYYQNYLTDKSFKILQLLKKKYDFVLIGGWAVYFYTHSLKSKDINMIVDYSELKKLKKDFPLEKNERLKKYQIKIEEVDIDLYLPFYSNLALPVEKLSEKKIILEGFNILKKEYLLLTKLWAYKKRKGSIKGEKDKIDIFALLLMGGFDFILFKKIIKENNLEKLLEELGLLINETYEIKELNLNKHFLKIKKEKLKKELF